MIYEEYFHVEINAMSELETKLTTLSAWSCTRPQISHKH